MPYLILASHRTVNVHTFLHYHASVCTPFGQVCQIHSLYEIVSRTTHPTKGWLGVFDSIVLNIVTPYRMFLGTTYQSIMHPFKSLFHIHLHVLFLSLFFISLANCPCILFAVHSLFPCSSLIFLNSLGSSVSSCVIVLLVLTEASNSSIFFF